jgi:hypothetical protein
VSRKPRYTRYNLIYRVTHGLLQIPETEEFIFRHDGPMLVCNAIIACVEQVVAQPVIEQLMKEMANATNRQSLSRN